MEVKKSFWSEAVDIASGEFFFTSAGFWNKHIWIPRVQLFVLKETLSALNDEGSGHLQTSRFTLPCPGKCSSHQVQMQGLCVLLQAPRKVLGECLEMLNQDSIHVCACNLAQESIPPCRCTDVLPYKCFPLKSKKQHQDQVKIRWISDKVGRITYERSACDFHKTSYCTQVGPV